MDLKGVIAVGKALGDENRIRILELLADEEMCGCKLLERFDITQPTLSHHMKVLCDSGLVTARKEGKWSHYSLNAESVKEAEGFFQSLLEGGES